MSENVAERRNLFLNPRFADTGGKAALSGDAFFVYNGDGSLTIKQSQNGGFIDFDFTGLPSGETVVFHALFITNYAKTFRSNRLAALVSVLDNGKEQLLAYQPVQQSANGFDIRTAVPDNGVIRVQFNGATDGDVLVKNVQLELASTYDAAVAAGGGVYPVLFNWSTLPE